MNKEPIIIIFQNDILTISTRESEKNESKSIIVFAKAINPADGQIYNRNAGWLSRTLALHGTANTRDYVYNEALAQIAENKKQIMESLIAIGRRMEKIDNSGVGVENKISHPLTEGQTNKVRVQMQKNAPTGTNHL